MASTAEGARERGEAGAPVFVLGGGSVGRALAIARGRSGVEVVGAHCRTEASARRAAEATGLPVSHGSMPESLRGARTVVAALPDPAIRAVAAALAGSGLLDGREVVLHCSGARSAAELAPLAGL